jgi:hypothetical protein
MSAMQCQVRVPTNSFPVSLGLTLAVVLGCMSKPTSVLKYLTIRPKELLDDALSGGQYVQNFTGGFELDALPESYMFGVSGE